MAKLKRRLEQIYQKIDSIAKLGKDGFNNYGMYIDELLSSGEWSLFSDVMIRKYNINTQLYRSVEDIKSKTFDKIRFVTLSQFQQDLKDLYNFYGVYQNIFDIQLLSDNTILGQIKELDRVIENFPFYKDNELATYEKVIFPYIEVTKNNVTYTIDDEETTLIDKYKAAILDLINN